MSVTTTAPAAAGMPPIIATYHGIFSDIVEKKSKSKLKVSNSSRSEVIIPFIFASPTSKFKLISLILTYPSLSK